MAYLSNRCRALKVVTWALAPRNMQSSLDSKVFRVFSLLSLYTTSFASSWMQAEMVMINDDFIVVLALRFKKTLLSTLLNLM